MIRLILFEAAGPTGPAKVAAEMARLEAIYLKARKRKLPIDLFVSDLGDRDKPRYGITAYYRSDQVEDVRFLTEQTEGVS